MHTLNILLLEDEIFDATLIKKVLERSELAFNLTVVTDKEEFRAIIQADAFDVILADNYLPQFDASKALQMLRENLIDTPLILVTGTVSEEFAVNMMKAGACDYILKDRLQRLPNAIIGAVEKHNLDAERKKYLDDLIRNEALMKRSERLAHIGSWEVDLVTLVSNWSEENYRILDYIPGEDPPTLEYFLRRVHQADRRSIKYQIDDALLNASNCKFKCRIVDKRGTIKYLENEMFVTRGANDLAIHVTGFSIDITERTRAEDLLHRSEANLRTIFNNTETGFALLDTSLNLVSFNEPIYAFSIEQLAKPLEVGRPAIEFFRSHRWPIVQRILQDALKGITHQYEAAYPQQDGSTKWFYVCCHPVTDIDQRVMGIIMSEADITKRKLLELEQKLTTEDLILRNNVLEQFTYIISHNLRGPLTTIMGISNLIEDETLKEEDKIFFINGISESVKKLDNVIIDLNSVLEFKTKINECKEQVNFQDIVDDICTGLTVMPQKLHTNFEAPAMFTIKSYLHSIFYNLISNSIKYKQPHIPLIIDISSKKLSNKLILHFTDTGMGIDLQKKGDQVFGLYKRFHIHAAEGKGIGLFMVKTQVETLGGKINVKSQVNVGTQFIIEFDLNN